MSVIDAILDRSPEELIGALLVASAVSAVMAGLYALGRRKAADSPTFVGGLALAASVTSMLLAAGHMKYTSTNRNSSSPGTQPPPEFMAAFAAPPPPFPRRNRQPGPLGFRGAGWSPGIHIVGAADRDRDGRLTAEEAARLVREADTDGDGSVDVRDIDRWISGRPRNRPRPPDSSASPGPGNAGGSGDGPGKGAGGQPEDEATARGATSDPRPGRGALAAPGRGGPPI